MVEVELRGGLYSISVVAKVHFVHVELEDFVFGELPFKLKGFPQLFDFPGNGHFGTIGKVSAGDLLGKRASAGEIGTHQHVECGTGGAANGKAVMVKEGGILTAHQGVDEMTRQLVYRHNVPLDIGEDFGDQLSVAVVDLGGESRIVVFQLRANICIHHLGSCKPRPDTDTYGKNGGE